MVVDVYVEWLFGSGVPGNLIMTLHLWKGKNISKGCGIEMNIKWEQVQWCNFCVILTATIGMDSCGEYCIPDVINKLRITNAADSRTGIKYYLTHGNQNFWLI